MDKKMYISGKITGTPRHEAMVKFEKAEKIAAEMGYTPVNPLKIVPDYIHQMSDHESAWRLAMKVCLSAQMECDATLFLYDYQESRGARIELKVADELRHTCYFLNNGNDYVTFRKRYEPQG